MACSESFSKKNNVEFFESLTPIDVDIGENLNAYEFALINVQNNIVNRLRFIP